MIQKGLNWFTLWINQHSITQTGVEYQSRPLTIHQQLRLSPANFALNPLASEVQIPWMLQGAMMFSLLGAHVQGCVLHRNSSLTWHVETAMCGH